MKILSIYLIYIDDDEHAKWFFKNEIHPLDKNEIMSLKIKYESKRKLYDLGHRFSYVLTSFMHLTSIVAKLKHVWMTAMVWQQPSSMDEAAKNAQKIKNVKRLQNRNVSWNQWMGTQNNCINMFSCVQVINGMSRNIQYRWGV